MVDSPGSNNPAHHGVRPTLEFVVCLLVSVIFARTWFIEGFIVPSGSMADVLAGVHRQFVCEECGREFVSGTDLRPLREMVVCPNCGFVQQTVAQQADINGDRLLVYKGAFDFRAPRRWEVVVFRRPDQAEKVYIKRVVGLPGEKVYIDRGDVYIDGEIQRKSLDQFRAMAVLVHDSRFQSTGDSQHPPRWLGDGAASGWQEKDGRFVHAGASVHQNKSGGPHSFDWLTYRHWRRRAGESAGVEEAPIDDYYAYNSASPRSTIDSNDVTDLLLECRLKATGSGRLAFFATDGREQFRVEVDLVERTARLWHQERLVGTERIATPLLNATIEIDLALCDRQLLFAIDGQEVFSPYAYDASDLPFVAPTRPLAIGAAGLDIEIEHLATLRDVYYTRPRGMLAWAVAEPYHLGVNEYFTLGDNSPVSEDSRLWPDGPGVPEELLVGKPIIVHLPSRLLDAPWGQIQVPDPSRIRYIR